MALRLPPRLKINKVIFSSTVIFILIVAFYIRYPGVDFQLPDISNPDETILVHPALKALATKNFNLSAWHADWGLVYGPFYSYSLIVLDSLFFSCSKIFGWGYSLAGDNTPLWIFYYIGRFFSLIISLASILLLVKIVKTHFDKKTALIAAFFLATNPTHVNFSIYAKPDALMCFLLLAVIYFVLKIIELPKTKYYILAGFLSGLAIATKMNALFFPVLIIVAHLIYSFREKSTLKSYVHRILLNKNIYLCISCIFFGFFIGNPYSLFDFPEFIREVKTNFLTSGLGAIGAYESTGSILKDIFALGAGKTLKLIYDVLFKTLGDGYLIFLALISSIYVIIKHRKRDIVLILFALVTIFMSVPSFRAGSEHHIFPADIVLIIFSAMFLVEIFKNRKFFNNLVDLKTMKFIPKVVLNCMLIIVVIFFAKKPFSSSVSLVRYFTGEAFGIEESSARQWVLHNIPIGSRVAYSHGYGPYLSKKLYKLDERHPDDHLQFFEENYDYLIVNGYRRKTNDYPILFEDLKKITSLKTFPATSVFNHSIEVYPMKSEREKVFNIQLNSLFLKKNDYAGIWSKFRGERGKEFILLTEIYDDYGPSGYEGYIKQRILNNNQVVWENDIGDKTGSGWKKSDVMFLGNPDGTEIGIEVRAVSDKITPGWADSSLTRIKVKIFDRQGKEYPIEWRFIAENGRISRFRNLYTETLLINHDRETSFNAPSFELEADQYWIFKGAVYKKSDKKRVNLVDNWLTAGIRSGDSLVELSAKVASEGSKSLHLVTWGKGEFHTASTIIGQVIPREKKQDLEYFSIDFLINESHARNKDYCVKLNVLAESIGGQFLKKKTYILYNSNNEKEDFEFNKWITFQRNIKKDFNHLFMRWDYVDFISFTIELENNDTEPVGIYIDNVKTERS